MQSSKIDEMKARRLTAQEIHIGTPIEKCIEINAKLLEDVEKDGGYQRDILDSLVDRYEEPNGMTRWDSPLFTVPYDDEKPPFDDIWEVLVGSEGKRKTVKPNQATVIVCEHHQQAATLFLTQRTESGL